MLKHDLQFTGKEKITDVVCIEGKNPYEEIIFNDFRRLLSILQAFNEKVKLTYHLPYVDYMLFGIKLFLHNRISIDALHKFFIEILKEKNVYETRLTEMIKSLNLEELIALDIQSPFSPLLQLINIDSSQTLEDSLSALGVDVNAVNFPSEEDNATEEERHIRGFKQEKLLVRNCIKFLKENEAPGSQKIWDDLIDSQPFIKIFLSDDPALISFIEDNFIEDNIFYNPTILSLLSNFPDIKTIKELINNYPVLKNLCQDSTLNFLDNIDQGRSVKNLINSCPDKKTFISLMTNLLKKHDAEVKKLVSKHLNHKNFLINDLKQVLDSRSNEELKELKDLTNQYVAIKNLKKLLKYPAINELVTNNISIKEFMETPLKNIIDAIINESLTSFNHDLSETNINLIYNYPNPLNQSLIECSFDLANLLFLLREAQETQEKKKKPFETCSFLSATEKQIQSSFQLFQKKYKGYAPIINLTYFDTVLTYDAQNEKKSPNLTNTTGLAFYFYYPSTDLLNNELSYLLPLANDNLVAFATQENEKTLQNNHRTYSIQGNSMFHRQKSVPQLPRSNILRTIKKCGFQL